MVKMISFPIQCIDANLSSEFFFLLIYFSVLMTTAAFELLFKPETQFFLKLLYFITYALYHIKSHSLGFLWPSSSPSDSQPPGCQTHYLHG